MDLGSCGDASLLKVVKVLDMQVSWSIACIAPSKNYKGDSLD